MQTLSRPIRSLKLSISPASTSGIGLLTNLASPALPDGRPTRADLGRQHKSGRQRRSGFARGGEGFASLLSRTLLGLGVVIAIGSSAPAQVNYTNTVLNGCYSYRVHTTATSTPLLTGQGQELLGTMCFGGNGLANQGQVATTNGTVSTTAGTNTDPGSYAFAATNSPYFGMGVIKFYTPFPIGYQVAVNNVVGGVAGGYQLLRLAGDTNSHILGGSAHYQAPAGYYYSAAVLDGCYSFLSETTLTAPVAVGPGKDLLDVVCFSGGSGSSGTLTVGYLRDQNGSFTLYPGPIGGTYTITNTPGYGMGTMTVGTSCPANCVTYAIAVHDVNSGSGIARGFQFTLTVPAAGGQTKMEGGDAEFQQ